MNPAKRKKLYRLELLEKSNAIETKNETPVVVEKKEEAPATLEDKKEMTAEEPVVPTSSILKKKKVVNEPV